MSPGNDESRPGQDGQSSSGSSKHFGCHQSNASIYQNPFAERACVGAAMLGVEHADVVLSLLSDTDIVGDLRAATVLSVIRGMRSNGLTLDPVLVLGELMRRGLASSRSCPDLGTYLAELVEVAVTPSEAAGYARAVLEQGLRRSLVEAAATLTQVADGSVTAMAQAIGDTTETMRLALLRATS